MADSALKRLELRWRSAVMHTAARLAPRPLRAGPPDWDARQYRVLYLRYDRIGDMIMATGLLRAIAKSHPTIQLDVLASPSNAPVLTGNPYVHRVLQFDRKRKATLPSVLRMLRQGRYDAVVDGSVLIPSVTMMLLMLATGAPYRIGIGGRRNDFIYTLPVPPAPPHLHAIEQAAQTAIPFGVPPESTSWHTELFLEPDELAHAEAFWGPRTCAPRLLVNVSAFTRDRQWPLERYAAVVRHARQLEPNARVVVIAAPAEQAAALPVAQASGAELAHTASVRDAFALVATADAVFTPDTSIAHAAAATDTPVAVMFKGGWTLHAPYRAREVRLEADEPSLANLPVERALGALEQLLAMVRTA